MTQEVEYNPWMKRRLTPTDIEFIKDEEPYEDYDPYADKEPLEEDPHNDQAGGDPSDNSPYPDSSSHGDGHLEIQEKDTLESKPSSKSPTSNQPSSVYALGPRVIYSSIKSITIPS